MATKLTICVLAVIYSNKALLIKLPFDFLIGGSVFVAAMVMKSSISKVPDLKTKNKYVIIHCCNFSIWVVLYSIYAYGDEVMGAYKGSVSNLEKKLTTVSNILCDLIENYIDCFLMWQVVRYSRGKGISDQ